MEKQAVRTTKDTTADAIAEALRRGKTPAVDSDELGLAGVNVFAAVHDRLTVKLKEAFQQHLYCMEARPLSNEAEMRSFAFNVSSTLDTIGGKNGLGVKVPDGTHAGTVGRLSVVLAGPDKEPRFAISSPGCRAVLYRVGMVVPLLEIGEATPDPRKYSRA